MDMGGGLFLRPIDMAKLGVLYLWLRGPVQETTLREPRSSRGAAACLLRPVQQPLRLYFHLVSIRRDPYE
jgi:hypothetical protein